MVNKSNKLVSVIIVTCGVKNYLSRCLESLKCQSSPAFEVVVIDNSLNPDSSGKIKEYFPWIKVYYSEKNLFYCASLNKGIDSTHGDFVLCLNDDMVLGRDFIRESLKGFFIGENIGMVSGKILRQDGKILDSAGLFLSIFRTPRERGYGKPDLGQFEKEGFIFGVSGCAAFYRRKMLEEIKEGRDYFDQDLRMFYEDLDISWRANKHGWKAYYIPQAIAYHVRGGSFRPEAGLNKPVARKYLNNQLYNDLIKNRYIVMLKNETLAGVFFCLIPIFLYEICSWSYTVFFRAKTIRSLIKQRKYFLRALRKRKHLLT